VRQFFEVRGLNSITAFDVQESLRQYIGTNFDVIDATEGVKQVESAVRRLEKNWLDLQASLERKKELSKLLQAALESRLEGRHD
jgi:hypothetical protein